MSSRLQLDMRNLSLGRRHLVNAYEVESGIGVIAGNTVWAMPERLECEVLQKSALYKYTYLYLYVSTTNWISYTPSSSYRQCKADHMNVHLNVHEWFYL